MVRIEIDKLRTAAVLLLLLACGISGGCACRHVRPKISCDACCGYHPTHWHAWSEFCASCTEMTADFVDVCPADAQDRPADNPVPPTGQSEGEVLPAPEANPVLPEPKAAHADRERTPVEPALPIEPPPARFDLDEAPMPPVGPAPWLDEGARRLPAPKQKVEGAWRPRTSRVRSPIAPM